MHYIVFLFFIETIASLFTSIGELFLMQLIQICCKTYSGGVKLKILINFVFEISIK